MPFPPSPDNVEYKFKILVLGSGRVGKTSLVRNFVEKKFTENYIPTIGVNLVVKDLKLSFRGQELEIRLTMWDLSGQEMFKPMQRSYHQAANGVFYVADLTWPQSFETLPQWQADLKMYVRDPIPAILLANKNDLPQVADESAINQAVKALQVDQWYKTSAKTGANVQEAFRNLTLHILEKSAPR